jgi:hypothetical protein
MSIRTASFALAAALTAAAPAAALASPPPIAAHVERTTAPAPAATRDARSYADREARSGKVADYEGGNVVVVISGSALLVALLIVLILT